MQPKFNIAFQVGTWVHYAEEIDVHFYNQNEYTDLTDYLGSNVWEIIENKATRRHYDG